MRQREQLLGSVSGHVATNVSEAHIKAEDCSLYLWRVSDLAGPQATEKPFQKGPILSYHADGKTRIPGERFCILRLPLPHITSVEAF